MKHSPEKCRYYMDYAKRLIASRMPWSEIASEMAFQIEALIEDHKELASSADTLKKSESRAQERLDIEERAARIHELRSISYAQTLRQIAGGAKGAKALAKAVLEEQK